MSEDKKLIPKRRFKEFENAGAWEQRRLGEVVEIIMGQSPKGDTYSYTPNKYILVQGNTDLKNGWVMPRIWTTQQTKKASKGDLIMSVRAPAGVVGKTDYDVVIGRGVAAIKGNEFIFQYLTKLDLEGYWNELFTGSTFESLNTNDIYNARISLPSLDEQIKIGRFFNEKDNEITLHQRKLEKLKADKKAYLSEMFPAEGEHKPKLRFEGFNDDWEQRRLQELGVILTGSTPSTNIDLYYSNDGIPWVTPTDITNNITYSSERKLSKIGQLVSKVVPKNTILVTCIASIGKNTILGTAGAFNQQINGLIPNKDIALPYFLYISSYFWSKNMKKSASSGTMQIVNKREFSEINTMVPKIDEQIKIQSFFKNIDNQITLHQRRLEKLKNIKKAYLNEMFI